MLRAALADAPSRRFFAAHAQSCLGSGLAYVALPLLAYDRFGSPWAIAAVLLPDLLPSIVLGPLLGALVVGIALEYFKAEFGNTPLHLVATGLLLGLVVVFMPDGVLPALGALARRVLRPPAQSSIREVSAAELREQRPPEATVQREEAR